MVQTGLQILMRRINDGHLATVRPDERLGLLCHGSSVDERLRYSFDLLVQAGYDLRFVIAPEHGIFGEVPYMERVDDARLEHIGVPIVSLYKDSEQQLRPPAGLLDEIDCLIVDIQDVGSRYYTYMATMAMLMEAAAQTGTRLIVLDRPNPVGLTRVEGNIMQESLRSFVGYMPIPARHALTPGEAAQFYRRHAMLDLDLTVVPCHGLDRRTLFEDTGLPWVPPSPNMPHPSTALAYTGMCLLEGTNISEGRGTASPFFLAGAPWISDPWKFVGLLELAGVPGVAFRPVRFTPAFDKWAGMSCGGVQMAITNPDSFRSLFCGMAIISTAARMYPDYFELRKDAYEFVDDIPALDLLIGDRTTGKALIAGLQPRELADELDRQSRTWLENVDELLLYR